MDSFSTETKSIKNLKCNTKNVFQIAMQNFRTYLVLRSEALIWLAETGIWKFSTFCRSWTDGWKISGLSYMNHAASFMLSTWQIWISSRTSSKPSSSDPRELILEMKESNPVLITVQFQTLNRFKQWTKKKLCI